MNRKNRCCYSATVFCVLIFICLWNDVAWMKLELKAEDAFIVDETDLFVPEETDVTPNIPIEQNQTESEKMNQKIKEQGKQNAKNQNKANQDKVKRDKTNQNKINQNETNQNETNKVKTNQEQDSISENQISKQDDRKFHYPNKTSAPGVINGQKQTELSDKNTKENSYKEQDRQEAQKEMLEENAKEIADQLPEDETAQTDETIESKEQKDKSTYWRYFIILGGVLLAGGTWRMILQVENNGAL